MKAYRVDAFDQTYALDDISKIELDVYYQITTQCKQIDREIYLKCIAQL